MDRRTAIRTLATASILPALAPERVSALLQARQLIGSGTASDFLPAALTRRELEIVGIVADIILPRSDTPSATDVAVPAFVDLVTSEWMDDVEAEEIHSGLSALDLVATDRFGAGFVELGAEQQFALIRALDEQLPEPGSDDAAPDGFYPTLKRLVLVGYFTTETGASQTGYRIMPGAFGGCVVSGVGR
ncbi:MAG: gluconate 2-dehydrogenase subunit 3 family protein [Longimicrobiales bacterium]|nr:gluconate 2-dehydrogenase subunit 3 family protein [Longimicrobiales bacterium]